MNFNLNKTLWFVIVFGAICFTYGAAINIDPDFGWHIKLGELTISNGGVFATDPFSYTMPSFLYIDHEWLTNIFLYLFYEYFGNIATALVHVLMLFFALFLAFGRVAKKISPKIDAPVSIFFWILAFGVFLTFFGIRPQVESWLLYSVFLSLLLKKEDLFERYFYLAPFFQIVWTNLHGSFPLPITTLAIFIVAKLFKSKKVWWKGLVTLVLCIVATGINPYGFHIWYEVIQSVTDSSLRWTVVEWKPVFFFFNIFYLVSVVLYFFSLKSYLRLFSFELVVLNTFFFFQGLASMRHVPIWFLINAPMQLEVLSDFYVKAGKIEFARARFIKLLNGFSLLLFVFFAINFLEQSFSQNKSLREDIFYPKKALAFLKSNTTPGNIFSDYGWGGYLIWKHPEKKVFIDGRMPSWKWSSNPANESGYAMEEYVNFLNGDLDMEKNFEKYNIDTVLWPSKQTNDISVLNQYILNNFFKKDTSNIFSMTKYMAQKGWVLVYQDEVASIYQKYPN